MEKGKVRRLVQWFQNASFQDCHLPGSVQYRTEAVRVLMRRNRFLFDASRGVSEVSGRWESCSSDRSRTAETNPHKTAQEPPKTNERVDKKSNGSKSGSSKGKANGRSDASRCSAGVQTDSILDAFVPGSDLVRILREIEQALISKSGHRRQGALSNALSLLSKPKRRQGETEKSSRTEQSSSTSSQKSSTSHVASPRRDESDLLNMKKVGQKSTDSVDSPGRPLDVRASSTPVFVKSTEHLKVSSGDSELGPTSAGQKSSVIGTPSRETDSRTPRLESVDSEPPAQQKKTDQGTQMSARGSPKDIGTSPLRLCEICSCLPCTCKPVSSVTRKEKGTQMSPQPCQKCQKTVCACSVRSGEKIIEKPCLNCKTTPCACLSSLCSTCGKTSCRCPPPSERSPLPETQACQHCKKTSCGCQIKRSRSSGREKLPSSGRQLKEINGEVFATHLDDDFTSSEVISSSSVGTDNNSRDSSRNKENAQCSVCRCPKKGNQTCVFCVCHIDRKTHIPRCDCHDKIPRILLPGFCKCHKRNLRHFDKCSCSDQVDMVDVKKCPCCQYFASRMRASLIAAQLEGSDTSSKKRVEPLPPKKYFLKLEETEVSKGSSEISETERRPMEVVTIKIPVKRMGKARVPCRQFYYSGDVQRSSNNHEKDVEYLDDIVKKYTELLSSRRSGLSKDDYLDLNRKKGGGSGKESGPSSSSYRTLQECLESNRPDFFNSAEYRRAVIMQRSREREQRQHHQNRIAASPPIPKVPGIFTTKELRKQTLVKCKRLSEVTEKKDERKKCEGYRTNKLKATIFAKRLQLKTLKGQLDLSNSCNLLTN